MPLHIYFMVTPRTLQQFNTKIFRKTLLSLSRSLRLNPLSISLKRSCFFLLTQTKKEEATTLTRTVGFYFTKRVILLKFVHDLMFKVASPLPLWMKNLQFLLCTPTSYKVLLPYFLSWKKDTIDWHSFRRLNCKRFLTLGCLFDQLCIHCKIN